MRAYRKDQEIGQSPLHSTTDKPLAMAVSKDADSTLEMAAPEDNQNIVDTLYNENGNINYEHVKDVAGRVTSGELEIERLDPEGERGRIAGGQRNVEASIIAGAEENPNSSSLARRRSSLEGRHDRRKHVEQVLEAYAKSQGIWFDYKRLHRRGKLLGGGVEAEVFDDDKFVGKLVDYRAINKDALPIDFLDRTSLFNTIFPETRYELVGFTRDNEGRMRFAVRQPFVKGDAVSRQQVEAFMNAKGFHRTDRYGESFANNLYKVHDLHSRNAMQDKNGTVYVIDAVPKLTDAAKAAIKPFAVREVKGDNSNILEMAASEFDAEAFRKERDAVSLEYVKGSDIQLAGPNDRPSTVRTILFELRRKS